MQPSESKPKTLDEVRAMVAAMRAHGYRGNTQGTLSMAKPGRGEKDSRSTRHLKPRDRRCKRRPQAKLEIRTDQLYWPVSAGIPFSSNENGCGQRPGFRVPDPLGLSVRDRMRSMTYATAFLSGVIAIRIPKPTVDELTKLAYGSSVSHSKIVKSIGQGWYSLKLYSLRYLNPAIIRLIVSVATNHPQQVLSIYGASYASLCRRPSTDLISRMGGGWLLPLVAANPWQSLETLLKCSRGHECLRQLNISANKISRVHALLNRKSQSTCRTRRTDLRRSAQARHVTAVRAP